jgi:hypothetical protein
MAEIEIVRPVDGAEAVVFDYGAASRAIDALNTMCQQVNAQVDGRVGAREHVIVHWEGGFRDEFADAYDWLQFRFGSVTEAAGYFMTDIYNAIDDANEMQRIYNDRV